MQEDDFRTLVEHCLAAVARMDQRDEQLAQQLPAIIEEHTSRWLRSVAGQVETAARAGLESPVAACEQRLRRLAAEADQAVMTMQEARRGFESMLRWVGIGAGVCLVLSIIALGETYEMLYGHYQQQYDRLRSAVPYMQAVNHSDVVPCGDGRLCARIDEKAPRLGDKKQYRLVEPRK